jgi:hypothetical protein
VTNAVRILPTDISVTTQAVESRNSQDAFRKWYRLHTFRENGTPVSVAAGMLHAVCQLHHATESATFVETLPSCS